MKIGIKIWEPIKELDRLVKEGRPDFIETLAIVGKDYRPLKDYGIPITVHAEHMMKGVNPANPMLLERNLKSVDFAVKTADMLNAEIIVVHPGCMENHSCSLENSVSFLRSVFEPRMLVENLPYYLSKEKSFLNLGKSAEEIGGILAATKMGFCLDFGHVPASAFGLGMDFMEMLKGFLELKPSYFHVSDTGFRVKTDEHLHLGKGDLDLPGIKKMIPRNAWVALETPPDVEGRVRDIELMRS